MSEPSRLLWRALRLACDSLPCHVDRSDGPRHGVQQVMGWCLGADRAHAPVGERVDSEAARMRGRSVGGWACVEGRIVKTAGL